MKFIALIINILAIPAMLFSGAAAMMSPMMFDAPESQNMISLKIAFYCLLSLPLALLITQIFAWKRFIEKNYFGGILAYKWVGLIALIFVISLIWTSL